MSPVNSNEYEYYSQDEALVILKQGLEQSFNGIIPNIKISALDGGCIAISTGIEVVYLKIKAAKYCHCGINKGGNFSFSCIRISGSIGNFNRGIKCFDIIDGNYSVLKGKVIEVRNDVIARSKESEKARKKVSQIMHNKQQLLSEFAGFDIRHDGWSNRLKVSTDKIDLIMESTEQEGDVKLKHILINDDASVMKVERVKELIKAITDTKW